MLFLMPFEIGGGFRNLRKLIVGDDQKKVEKHCYRAFLFEKVFTLPNKHNCEIMKFKKIVC